MADLHAAYSERIIADTTYLVCSQSYGLYLLLLQQTRAGMVADLH
jgi:hypothetical protein